MVHAGDSRARFATMLAALSAIGVVLAASTSTAARTASTQCQPTAAHACSVEPAWSPRGDAIVFVTMQPDGNRALEIVRPDGTPIRTLVPQDQENVGSPAWSPDGKLVVFGCNGFDFIAAAGGAERRLRLPVPGCLKAWGPGGRKIAYSSSPETQASIYVVSPDGRGFRSAVEPGGDHSFWGPTWSPHGAKLAFFADDVPDQPPSRQGVFLGVIDKVGGRVRRLKSGRFEEPAWSPNGKLIAADGIRVLDLETRRVTQLHLGSRPSWSPNSRQLAFDFNGEIDVMNADGSNVHQISH